MSVEFIAAVIVAYNPKQQIVGNVATIANQVRKVIVVDNTPSTEADPHLQLLETRFGCTIIRNHQNLGIAIALNLGVKYAMEIGCNWVCTLDQDSVACTDFISEMLATYRQTPQPERIALITPHYVDRESKVRVRLRCSTSGEILTTMTSGSMVPSIAIRKLGFFDEDLFIDGVDTEFCLRARREGMIILQSPALLWHSLGRTTYHRILGLRFGTTNHSAERHYYISRNRIRLLARYAKDWPWVWRELRGTVFDIIKICLVEKGKLKKFYAMMVGIVDALSGKVGKRIEL